MARKVRLGKPIIKTAVSTYFSSQSKEERARNERNRTSMINNKPMIRLAKKYKMKARKGKSSGGSGG